MSKTLIAIPCLDMMHTQFVCSLVSLRLTDATEFRFSQNSLVYDSRNQLAEYAIRQKYDRVFFVDSDMTFPANTIEILGEDLKQGADMVCGLFTTRKKPIRPVIYSEIKRVGTIGAVAKPMEPKPDCLFEIGGCGFGAVLIKTSALDKVYKNYGFTFSPMMGMGEDISFCYRAKEQGLKIYCDSRVICGHIGMTEYKPMDIQKIEVEK